LRTFKNVQINRNTFVNNQNLNQDVIRLQEANFQDFSCVDNVYNGPYVSTNGGFIGIADATFEGTFNLIGNNFGAVGQGFLFLSPFATMTIRAQTKVDYLIKDNRASGIGWGLRGILPAHPTGSTFTLVGNRFNNQAVRTDIVATAFVAAGGKAKAIDNFFDGAGNVLTGFTVPGKGLGTILTGAAFVDITHGLIGAPTNVIVTSRSNVDMYLDGAPGGTTFRVRARAGSVAADAIFYWQASNIVGQ
jgi:hypothetical protein